MDQEGGLFPTLQTLKKEGVMATEIINKPLKEIKPYENNPRKNDKSVNAVAKSIEQFGFKVPIVIDSNNQIVCGHTRFKAANMLHLESVPCIIADDLTDDQVKAFRLVDNKVSEASEWDQNLLKLEIEGIIDLDLKQFGFELDAQDMQFDAIDLDDGDNSKSKSTHCHCPKCGFEFEV